MTPIVIEYNHSIVILSILIAVFASYITLELINVSRDSNRKKRRKWLIAGAFTMGLGIWTMHFTGMIAIGIGEKHLSLNLVTTIVSLLVPIIGSLVAFQFIIRNKMKKKHFLFAGMFMGLSIASMHYTGMYAVNFGLYMEHHLPLILLSILIGIGGSLLALLFFSKLSYRNLHLYQLPIAVLLGLVISSMHYVGMSSFTLYDRPHQHSVLFPDVAFSFNSSIMINILVFVIALFFVIIYTLSIRNKKIQYEMYEMAFYDSLTELPNRYYLDHAFQTTLDRNKKKKEKFAVFFLDLDDFKEVNDQYGHEVGDQLLKQIGKMLTLIVDDHMVVSRHGGDEFIILAKKNG